MRATHVGAHVQRQVGRVAQLAPHGAVLEHGVELLGVGRHGRGLGVLDVLAQPQRAPHQAELPLDGAPRRDARARRVGAQQVPGVEAREVLDRAQELVATDCERGRGGLVSVGSDAGGWGGGKRRERYRWSRRSGGSGPRRDDKLTSRRP